MEIKMSGSKEVKPKTVQLFHISQSLFKNKRLKRRRLGLASKIKQKSPKKRSKPKSKKETDNEHSSQNLDKIFTIEIVSTEDEQEEEKESSLDKNPPEVETSIVLSSDDEDAGVTQARIFPMLTSQTTVQTEVGNAVFELSLTQLKENLQTITKRKKHRNSNRLSKRLNMNNSNMPADLSISLLSDDDEREEEVEDKQKDNNLDKLPSAMKA